MQIEDLQLEVESVSDYYAERHSIDRTDEWFVLKLNEEVGELTQAYLGRAGQARHKGRTPRTSTTNSAPSSPTCWRRFCSFAERFNIDVADEVKRKWPVWKRAR